MFDLAPPPLFIWGLFATVAVGGLLPVRLDQREDHVVPTIVSAVCVSLLGAAGLLIALAGFLASAIALLVWSRIPHQRERLHPDGVPRSIAWLGVTALSITVGFIVANFLYATVLGRTYPYSVATSGDAYVGAAVGTFAWVGAMSVRIVSQRFVTGSVLARKFDPFDSMLIPYLLPTVCGFPLIAASIALYHPNDPWPTLTMLLWTFPLSGLTRFELHRRRLGQELRRETLAKQRLAAIGEVSARIVHQSRHQVGLMGWSIYRLRAQIEQGALGSEEEVLAAKRELDALTDAKDRLSEMLASELLHEGRADLLEEDPTSAAATAADAPRDTATLAEVVADVVHQLGAKADHAGVLLRVDAPPDAGADVAATQLRDVLFNLVDNAVDAARACVTVEISSTDPERDVVRVCDDGPGLPEREAARVFEPFFTTKGDGTGMGLAIADALVGDLGGDLRYERVGDLTVFSVALPAVRDQARSRTPAP